MPKPRSPGNHLVDSESPYLLQHAHNPVHWYPWGDEPLGLARETNKPVFLSIGYSTCHWCHVMAHESFEEETVADLLNQHFVSIKVDREERPDLDEIYMTATQLLTGRGGWPNSLWLTPEGDPFYAGTYFPPEDRSYGGGTVPGFKTVTKALAKAWAEEEGDLRTRAKEVSAAMKRSLGGVQACATLPDEDEAWGQALDRMFEDFDGTYGGFGQAPKFPPHQRLLLLLEEWERTSQDHHRNMIESTLGAMARGGIHDHLGGGFHRYATDRVWLLPHFEKMLYDNGQLLQVYAEAYRLFGKEEYRRIAERLVAWLLREMTDKEGGFYSALDADTEGEEGLTYLWTVNELKDLLGDGPGDVFAQGYNLRPEGNFKEEASGKETMLNILHRSPATALYDPDLTRYFDRLLAAREQRAQPHLDDKVLVAWNGLMISGLARAGAVFDNASMIETGRRAADFILRTMNGQEGLARVYRQGRVGGDGYLEDYVLLADGLLDLAEACGESGYADGAAALMEQVERNFASPQGGFFQTGGRHESLIARARPAVDQSIPSGNGIAARVYLRLALLGKADVSLAENLLQTFSGTMAQHPQATVSLYRAFGELRQQAGRAANVSIDLPERGVSGLVGTRVATTMQVSWADNMELEQIEVVAEDGPWRVEPVCLQGGEAAEARSIPLKIHLPETPGDYALPIVITFRFCADGRCWPPLRRNRVMSLYAKEN